MKKRAWINADPKKRKTYHNGGGETTTVKVKRPICRISNESLGSADPRLCYLIVHGEKVPVNSEAFSRYCRKVGWQPPTPKIFFKDSIDVEPWLINIAKQVAAAPAKEAKWFDVQYFADMIGLKTNLITAVR